ncbi:tRNA (guanine(37)-N1)-methyltransferase [Aricia agestis]|uniref:tRNA (guanine(37)-N1)-methyltransferase n=1 Tax=Aricia agestis TaxID=91739 RepID=UPI001C201B1E|nr:tRNA (guanine(37)-N1)-methyltransferase [Aricia agestis]
MKLTLLRRCFGSIKRKMHQITSSSIVPLNVRGMKELDRQKFLRKLTVPILRIPEEKVSKITKTCKPYFLKMENIKPVQSATNSLFKEIILNPDKVTKWSDISESDYQELQKHGVDEASFITKDIQLGYDNFKYETIFKAVLPEGEETVSGFSQIGHIIHLNLRDHLLDYAPLIGQVLMDKIKTCRTVVNKSNIIDNTYRNFKMDVIAGDEDFLVTVKENQCQFQFDFSKVYWNPRLGKEHERILSFLKPGDVLFDVFCGVGPFSIPAAKRKCRVFANDLNPDSFKWLNENAKNNKINNKFFKSFNEDGKDFICNTFKEFIEDLCNGKEQLPVGAKVHVTMNLPALAVEFLKYFKHLITDKDLSEKINCDIIVYLYCFAVGDNPFDVAKRMVIDNIGVDMSSDILDIFDVRNVSPKKEMIRVTFKLTKDVLFGVDSDTEPPKKKMCINEVNENK